MTLVLNYVSQVTFIETSAGPYVDPADATQSVRGLNTSQDLNASSVPPVTKATAYQVALTAGAATIDLTSLPNKDGVAGQVNFTGLKVQVYKFRNKSTNLNTITLTFGASNPYLLHGAAWKYILGPNEEMTFKGFDNANMPDVDSTHKNIDVAGTGTDTLEVELSAG